MCACSLYALDEYFHALMRACERARARIDIGVETQAVPVCAKVFIAKGGREGIKKL